MDQSGDIDVSLYTKKERIPINLKNKGEEYLYELELVKKVKTSPTSYLFVFEYGEDIKEVIEVDIFSVFLFIGEHEKPTVPGTWNGTPLDEEDKIVKRKYTPIYIDVDKREVHFLIRIYSQTSEYPDGGKFTRYLDNFVPSETVNITGFKPRIKLVEDNVIKLVGRKVEFDTINLAAGGTGITPFIRLLNYYQDLPFDINLIYSNRSFDEILLKALIDRHRAINKRLKVTYLVSREEEVPEGIIASKITEEIIEKNFSNTDKAVTLFCGPPGFNDLVFDILHKLDFKNIHRL